ncbi:MAG: hypothetical protein ACI9BD_000646 [Candidatus Marinamargulisbacteria bacterium]|jgi:hypothetical protein
MKKKLALQIHTDSGAHSRPLFLASPSSSRWRAGESLLGRGVLAAIPTTDGALTLLLVEEGQRVFSGIVVDDDGRKIGEMDRTWIEDIPSSVKDDPYKLRNFFEAFKNNLSVRLAPFQEMPAGDQTHHAWIQYRSGLGDPFGENGDPILYTLAAAGTVSLANAVSSFLKDRFVGPAAPETISLDLQRPETPLRMIDRRFVRQMTKGGYQSGETFETRRAKSKLSLSPVSRMAWPIKHLDVMGHDDLPIIVTGVDLIRDFQTLENVVGKLGASQEERASVFESTGFNQARTIHFGMEIMGQQVEYDIDALIPDVYENTDGLEAEGMAWASDIGLYSDPDELRKIFVAGIVSVCYEKTMAYAKVADSELQTSRVHEMLGETDHWLRALFRLDDVEDDLSSGKPKIPFKLKLRAMKGIFGLFQGHIAKHGSFSDQASVEGFVSAWPKKAGMLKAAFANPAIKGLVLTYAMSDGFSTTPYFLQTFFEFAEFVSIESELRDSGARPTDQMIQLLRSRNNGAYHFVALITSQFNIDVGDYLSEFPKLELMAQNVANCAGESNDLHSMLKEVNQIVEAMKANRELVTDAAVRKKFSVNMVHSKWNEYGDLPKAFEYVSKHHNANFRSYFTYKNLLQREMADDDFPKAKKRDLEIIISALDGCLKHIVWEIYLARYNPGAGESNQETLASFAQFMKDVG